MPAHAYGWLREDAFLIEASVFDDIEIGCDDSKILIFSPYIIFTLECRRKSLDYATYQFTHRQNYYHAAPHGDLKIFRGRDDILGRVVADTRRRPSSSQMPCLPLWLQEATLYAFRDTDAVWFDISSSSAVALSVC